MREHTGLFRGKRLDSGEWVEGYLSKRPSAIQIGDYCPWYISVPPLDPDDNGGYYNVDPDTVGECTGLKDKNGKLIFEGDILEREYLGEKHRYTVVYSRAAFAWGEKNKYGLTGRFGKGIGTIEIIGNIHDNPELLEGASEKK